MSIPSPSRKSPADTSKRVSTSAPRGGTTQEFLHDLLAQSEGPLAEHREQLADFLHHCDLAKFARWQLSLPEMESMHESARAFVVETCPQPPRR